MKQPEKIDPIFFFGTREYAIAASMLDDVDKEA